MWGTFGNSRTTYSFVISASEWNIDRVCYIATYVYVTTSNYDAYTANAEGSILKIATNFFFVSFDGCICFDIHGECDGTQYDFKQRNFLLYTV